MIAGSAGLVVVVEAFSWGVLAAMVVGHLFEGRRREKEGRKEREGKKRGREEGGRKKKEERRGKVVERGELRK